LKYSNLHRTIRREKNNATQLLRISEVQPRPKKPETTSSRQRLCAIADRRSRSRLSGEAGLCLDFVRGSPVSDRTRILGNTTVLHARRASIPRLGKPKGAHRIRDATRGLPYPGIFSKFVTVFLLTGRGTSLPEADDCLFDAHHRGPRESGRSNLVPKNRDTNRRGIKWQVRLLSPAGLQSR
jgi:hypothetical protein